MTVRVTCGPVSGEAVASSDFADGATLSEVVGALIAPALHSARLDALQRGVARRIAGKPRQRKAVPMLPGKVVAPHLRRLAKDKDGGIWATAPQLAHVLEVAERRGVSSEAGISALMAELGG